MDPRLLDYYKRELNHIKEMGAEFAQEHPKIAGRLRLEGPFGSCPVATDSHLYAFSEKGLVQVIQLGGDNEGKVVGSLDLGEMIQCTPAVAHKAIFVRSNTHLWKLAGS